MTNSTKMTDAQTDQAVSDAYDLAHYHMDQGNFHAAYGAAADLRLIGLESAADALSESIFCVQHDC